MNTEPKKPPLLYLVYAQKDDALKQEFEDYLGMLRQSQLIAGWVERVILPRVDESQGIDERYTDGDMIVVLISPALCLSGYGAGAEVRELFRRKLAGQIYVIPILLRYVNLRGLLFETVQCIPRNQPVSSWTNRDEAWKEIDQEIRQVLLIRY